jgi:acyl carrier protein phosphodiesterase
MNYLAHLALSGEEEEIIIGNFIGDSLKGIDTGTFSDGIQKGIQLHRFIDNFTDHHPLFIETKKIFSKQYDKYAGALVDVFFDHFLAKSFYDFHGKDLEKFAIEKQEQIRRHYNTIPQRAQQFFNYMEKNNTLYSYHETEGIRVVLEGLTDRIEKKVLLYKSFDLFLANYETIEKTFRKFYRELKFASMEFIELKAKSKKA